MRGTLATAPVAADLNADGLDDLLYPAKCGEATCWYGQLSIGTSFAASQNLGLAHPDEVERKELFDFDGEGDDDLITVLSSETSNDLVMRRAGPDGLGDSTMVIRFDQPVLERRHTGSIRRRWRALTLHFSMQGVTHA